MVDIKTRKIIKFLILKLFILFKKLPNRIIEKKLIASRKTYEAAMVPNVILLKSKKNRKINIKKIIFL